MTKKTTTTGNRAQSAKDAMLEAEHNPPAINVRDFFKACDIVQPTVHTWPEFLDTIEREGIEAERRYIVQFLDSTQWGQFLDLIQFDRKNRTIPGNRDEKKGHADTLRLKDIPSLEAFDHRRGMHSINLETMHLIDAGHRTRVITDNWTRQKTGSVTIAIRFTDRDAEGFDGSQSKWTPADAAKTNLKLEGYDAHSAAFFAKFMDQGGKAIRCRLQNLSIEGGGQSAHKQDGRPLLAAQEVQLWSYDPLYIGIWNLTTKDAKDSNGTRPASTAGRTLQEIVAEDTLYLGKSKDITKARADHLFLSMVDSMPETFSDYSKVQSLLDLFEIHLGIISEAWKAFCSTDDSTENRYFWMCSLWVTLDKGHVPKNEQIEKYLDYSYPEGIHKIAATMKDERKAALDIVAPKQTK